MNEESNSETVKYTIKELLNDVRSQVAEIARDTSASFDRLESKLDSKADVAALQTLSAQVQALQLGGSIVSKKNTDDLKDLESQVYLAEQGRQRTLEQMREKIDALATSKDVETALKAQSDSSKSSRRILIFSVISSVAAIIIAVTAIVALLLH